MLPPLRSGVVMALGLLVFLDPLGPRDPQALAEAREVPDPQEVPDPLEVPEAPDPLEVPALRALRAQQEVPALLAAQVDKLFTTAAALLRAPLD